MSLQNLEASSMKSFSTTTSWRSDQSSGVSVLRSVFSVFILALIVVIGACMILWFLHVRGGPDPEPQFEEGIELIDIMHLPKSSK